MRQTGKPDLLTRSLCSVICNQRRTKCQQGALSSWRCITLFASLVLFVKRAAVYMICYGFLAVSVVSFPCACAPVGNGNKLIRPTAAVPGIGSCAAPA